MRATKVFLYFCILYTTQRTSYLGRRSGRFAFNHCNSSIGITPPVSTSHAMTTSFPKMDNTVSLSASPASNLLITS